MEPSLPLFYPHQAVPVHFVTKKAASPLASGHVGVSSRVWWAAPCPKRSTALSLAPAISKYGEKHVFLVVVAPQAICS